MHASSHLLHMRSSPISKACLKKGGYTKMTGLHREFHFCMYLFCAQVEFCVSESIQLNLKAQAKVFCWGKLVGISHNKVKV